MIIRYVVLTVLIFTHFIYAQNSQKKPDARGYIVEVGDQVTDFEMNLIDGTSKSLKDFNSKIIVLNFFASWCKVCRTEIPHIEKEVWQQYKNKNVTVVGVDLKEDLQTTQQFVNEMNITYPVVLDTAGIIFAKFAEGGVTRNIVLDENLEIIYLTRLFDKTEFNGMVAKIQSYVNNKSLKQSEANSMKEIELTNLTDLDKKISLIYNGTHKAHFEGKIFSYDKKNIEIGISIFDEDIKKSKYNKKTKSLDIYYKHFDGMRITILPMKKYKVPKEIEKVTIYDY